MRDSAKLYKIVLNKGVKLLEVFLKKQDNPKQYKNTHEKNSNLTICMHSSRKLKKP